MKLLLTAAFSMLCFWVGAQHPPSSFSKNENGFLRAPSINLLSKDTLPTLRLNTEKWLAYRFNNGRLEILSSKEGKPLYLNPQQPGVYSLPLDKMPCVVPDTKEIAQLPNGWKGRIGVPFYNQMPNPLQPRQHQQTK